QPEHTPAQLSDLPAALGIERPEHREQPLGGPKNRFIPRLIPSKASRVALAPGVQRQHRAGKIYATNLRKLERRQLGIFFRRPEADAPPRRGAPRTTRALGRRRSADALQLQPIEPALRVVSRDP